MINTNYEAAHY